MEKLSLYHLLKDTVSTHAERPAFWVRLEKQDFGAVSYANWRADMKSIQAFLVYELGVKKGDKIALLCDNRYEWTLLCFAIDTIGCVDVPRGTDATEQDILYILNHAETSIVIIENEKTLQKLVNCIGEIPSVQTIISIEGREKYKNFDKLLQELEENRLRIGKIQKLTNVNFYFLIDIINRGYELLRLKGEEELRRRGESIQPDDLATIIYTSGTTGTPKGVMLTHRNFCWEIAQIQLISPITEQDRVVIFLPPWHIAERVLEFTLIACGASMANSSIMTLAADLQTIKPTFLVSVPRVWEQLYKRIFENLRKQPQRNQRIFQLALQIAGLYTDSLDHLLDRIAFTEEETLTDKVIRKILALLGFIITLPFIWIARKILSKVRDIFGGKLKFALSGAGALPVHIADFFRYCGIPIIDAYGMTETTAVCAMGRLPMPKRFCVGPSLPGVHIQLRDEYGRIITKPGVKGIAWHKGPHVMKGYYKMPEKTAEVLQDGWLNSGDVFVWTTTGEIQFAGRAKDTIVLLGGENVEPEPIEVRLTTNPFIQQAVVVGQDQKSLGVLIYPNVERVKEELKNKATLSDNTEEWNRVKEVQQFFLDILKEEVSAKNGFKSFERITHIYILPKELKKGEELTETMKIKRNKVLEKYKTQIEEMFRN
ncbi:MAG: AMP-binding protein [Leptospiraceae bacterium]|nr:AMP-binding protein [Leptospiraceae bacterium]MDW7975038.1 AMP-binding protein [Leptospiraceae bacterium]